MRKVFYSFVITLIITLMSTSVNAQEIDPGGGITIGNHDLYCSTWSPDGKWIAGHGNIGLIIVSTDDNSKMNYCSVPGFVSNERNFVKGSEKICFTPDSSEIIVTMVPSTPGIDNSPILVAFNPTTKSTRLVHDKAGLGRFSRDGRFFFYINYNTGVVESELKDNKYTLAVENTETGVTSYHSVNSGKVIRDFSVSADNTYIIASIENENGYYSLYKMPMDDSEPVLLTQPDFPAYYNTPDCSPDGKWIMFNCSYNSVRELYVYNTLSEEITQIFPKTTVQISSNSWSPDGIKFCCNLKLPDIDPTLLHVYEFKPDNLGVSPIVKEIPLVVPSEFGTKLIDMSFDIESVKPETPIEVYRIKGEQAPMENILYSGYQVMQTKQFDPVWSPDNKWIASSTNSVPALIWITSSEGGEPILVYVHEQKYKGYYLYGGRAIVLGFTPDSNEVVFSTDFIDEEMGTVVKIEEGTTSTGSRYFNYQVSNPIFEIKAVNIYTGAIRTIARNADRGYYSHDGRYFIYNTFGYKAKIIDTTSGETVDFHPDLLLRVNGFAPGDAYVMANNIADNRRLVRIPVIGGEPETVGTGDIFAPSLSPDGEWLLYENAEKTLSVFNISSGNEYRLMEKNDEFNCVTGSFSPDGTKIVYTLMNLGDKEWRHIYTVDFDAAKYQKEIGVEKERPVEFAVVGSFPNPFNMATSIEISVNMAERFDLSVYNMAGQRIRTLLVNTALTPGIHHVLWDGADNSGKTVSTGVYFCRLVSRTHDVTKKMMLMK